MKLFTRYTRLNIAATLLIFLAASCVFFVALRFILIYQVDEALDTEREENVQYIKQYNRLPDLVSTSDQQISYEPVASQGKSVYRTIKQRAGGEEITVRQLTCTIKFSGQWYLFTITAPLEHTEDLLQIIVVVTLTMMALMLVVISLINRRVVKKVLKPFFRTIDEVSNYSPSRHDVYQLPATNIEEFTMLNNSINAMTERVQRDYRLLKDFTAHAAHEMQTPLAVMRTRLETLMQTSSISEEQAQQITGIESSLQKLSRLFTSLLMLTKVENRQFRTDESVRMDEVIADKCRELEEVLKGNDVKLSTQLARVSLCFNQYLAEMLVGNLLNNAIRYNYPGGNVAIGLTNERLSISNTSTLPQLDENSIYQPFYRHPDTQLDGSGLGLSIVKQICEVSGFEMRYSHSGEIHTFTILFK